LANVSKNQLPPSSGWNSSSETLINIYQTTQGEIPEDRSGSNHCRENRRSLYGIADFVSYFKISIRIIKPEFSTALFSVI
jgi:hypothetical protein